MLRQFLKCDTTNLRILMKRSTGARACRTHDRILLLQCTQTAYCPAKTIVTRPEGELSTDLHLPKPPGTWWGWVGGQLKTWAAMADLKPLSGPPVFGSARWRKSRVKISSKLAQGRRDWVTFIRDVIDSINTGSTRPSEHRNKPTPLITLNNR